MNKLLKVAICEDDDSDRWRIASMIQTSDMETECHTFFSGEELLKDFVAGRYNLIFLDIYMEGLLGIHVAQKIRELDTTVMLVFTTTSIEHTLESYRLGVPKYIEKPVNENDIEESLFMAMERLKSSNYIELLIGGVYENISLDSILYFEYEDHRVSIYTISGILKTSQMINLNQVEKLLPKTFIRPHHSFIANLRYIKAIDRETKSFIMQNGDKVYITYKNMKKMNEAYESYLFERARSKRL